MEKKELREQLDNIRKKIDEVNSARGWNFDDEAFALEIDALYAEHSKICNTLILMDYNFVIGNDVVDLYKENNDYFEGDYVICLHDTLTEVGHIDYRPGSWNMGNIGYSINEDYKGNNYAFHAVCLLFDILCLNNVSDAVISIHMDNMASHRVMDKLREAGYECEIIEDRDYEAVRYNYKIKRDVLNNHKR